MFGKSVYSLPTRSKINPFCPPFVLPTVPTTVPTPTVLCIVYKYSSFNTISAFFRPFLYLKPKSTCKQELNSSIAEPWVGLQVMQRPLQQRSCQGYILQEGVHSARNRAHSSEYCYAKKKASSGETVVAEVKKIKPTITLTLTIETPPGSSNGCLFDTGTV